MADWLPLQSAAKKRTKKQPKAKPSAGQPDDSDAELLADWSEARALAEGVASRFEERSTSDRAT